MRPTGRRGWEWLACNVAWGGAFFLLSTPGGYATEFAAVGVVIHGQSGELRHLGFQSALHKLNVVAVGDGLLRDAGIEMRLISKRETADIVGFHPEHVMRLARQGRFPRPIKTGSSENCAVRFIAAEVDAWIAARMADRDAAVA